MLLVVFGRFEGSKEIKFHFLAKINTDHFLEKIARSIYFVQIVYIVQIDLFQLPSFELLLNSIIIQ